MPETKKQPTRIRIINECLSIKGSYWSKEQLLAKMEDQDLKVSDRTLEFDIADMKNCGQLQYYAPIKWCKINKGYHYTDPNYSFDKLPLSKQDIRALEIAASTLKQYEYIPLMREFTTTIDKIIRVVNRVKKGNNDSLLDFIEFEKTPTAAGLEHMDAIIDAIQNHKAILLDYHSFERIKPVETIVHPYFIKEYRNRWYVIALKEGADEIRTYAFDRINSIKDSQINYKPNTRFLNNDYLKNCIGIHMGIGKIEKVILQFNAKEGKYITTQALHHSQSILTIDKDGVKIELNLIINFELISIILGYGSNVKVLEPSHLKEKVTEIAQNIIRGYRD
jgi:predicted DNA-binding transcriptional regulator YafY